MFRRGRRPFLADEPDPSEHRGRRSGCMCLTSTAATPPGWTPVAILRRSARSVPGHPRHRMAWLPEQPLVSSGRSPGALAMNSTRQHWNDVWSKKAHAEVSWYQADPGSSLAWFDRIGIDGSDDVIDVGCGASHLADRLIVRGIRQLHLLDVSSVALDQIRSRIASKESATVVEYLATDVLNLDPPPSVSLWHDRAVLHFIRDQEERRRYAEIAAAAVRPGGASGDRRLRARRAAALQRPGGRTSRRGRPFPALRRSL